MSNVSFSGICTRCKSLGLCPKGVYPIKYVGAFGYVQGYLFENMSRGYVFGCKSKGGIFKGEFTLI